MQKGGAVWKVLPHGPVERVSENLWRVEGELSGLPMKRVMTLVKRADGDLIAHNAMALSPEAMAKIEAWGKIRYVIVPNGWHRMDVGAYKDRYPEVRVYCPRGAQKRVAEVVTPDGVYEDFPNDDTVSFTTLDGVGETEGVMTVKSQDGVTLVINDAVFNMPHVGGFHGFVFKHITKSSGGLKVTRLAKLLVVKNSAAFRAHLERLAATPNLTRIIVSHHQMVNKNAAEELLAAARVL